MRPLLTKREKLILYITVCVIGLSVAFNLFIAPILKEDDSLNKEINITRAKLRKYISLLSQKESIQNAYNKFFATFKMPAPQENTVVAALSELENLAKAAGINIIDIKPQMPKSLALHYREVLVDLKTEGSIGGYLKFIYTIEKSLSLLRIKRFQLNPKPNTQSLEGNLLISQLSLTK